METITTLQEYSDERGNTIEVLGEISDFPVKIQFRGSNNRLIVQDTSMLRRLHVFFLGDNNVATVGKFTRNTNASWTFTLGYDSEIRIGTNVSTASTCSVFAAEGAQVRIGNDCMIAADCRIRADDAHPIYDIESGARLNPSQNIVLREHVWLAYGVMVMPGVTIGQGTVVGTLSVVTKSLPNNVVAVGTPARVVRQNVAWERTDIKKTRIELDEDGLPPRREKYWNPTVDKNGRAAKYARSSNSALDRRVGELEQELDRASRALGKLESLWPIRAWVRLRKRS